MAAEDFPTLALCLQAYLDGLEPSLRPTQAAFGVACPITGDQVKLTNRDWSFSIEGLKQTFGLDRLEVVNDFTAIGHSIGALTAKDVESLPGPAWPERLTGVVSIVGPGTGLGVGAFHGHGVARLSPHPRQDNARLNDAVTGEAQKPKGAEPTMR